ncbi:MAG: hypothetical protein K0U68_09740 [Gammaproteobacteria bacterium]|nr:hypothetical protein [Gammaproteobacteria bacterium]
MGLLKNKELFTFVFFIALGFGGTAILKDPNAIHYINTISPIEFVSTHDHHHETIGGEHPTEILVSGDEREVFERHEAMQFSITNNFNSAASVSFSYLLSDEQGNEVMSEPASSVQVLEPGETVDQWFDIPAFLNEGLFSMQVTVAGHANGEFADSGVDLNFAIINNKVYMLNNEEWMKYSLANQAKSY